MNDCCSVELTVTEDPQVTLDIQEQFVNGGGGITPTGTKTINVTENGTTTTNVTHYANAQVVANVPNTYAAADEGKVVDNGTLVAQGSAEYTVNGTYDTTLISSVEVSVSGDVPVMQTKSVSYTPTESAQSQTVTPDAGYGGLSSVSVSVGAISDTYVGSGITRRDDDDLTASGPAVSVPAGYYESSASKAVASGTAGAPTATKGAVSNHSVSVTPSVTNSAGYVASETKTGPAVTVSASELVSGTKSITANGIGIDVTDYAAVDVAVSGGGGGSGLTTIASGTFVGDGTQFTTISIGTKMAQTDFMVKIKAQTGSEFTYDTSYKFAWFFGVIFHELGHYNLSTNGNEKDLISDIAYNVNNSGTISSITAGDKVRYSGLIRQSGTNNTAPNQLRINRSNSGFGVFVGHSNTSYKWLSSVTYDWEIIYFGSDPSNDIVEVS